MRSIIYRGAGGFSTTSFDAKYNIVLPTIPECSYEFKSVYNFTKKGGPDILLIDMYVNNIDPDPDCTEYPDLRNIALQSVTFNLKNSDITEINRPATREDLQLNGEVLVIVYHDDAFDLEDAIKKYHDNLIVTEKSIAELMEKLHGFIPKKSGMGTLRPI